MIFLAIYKLSIIRNIGFHLSWLFDEILDNQALIILPEKSTGNIIMRRKKLNDHD